LGIGLLLCLCVTVMCCHGTVAYRVTVLCVCYCNVLLQYSWVYGYYYVCVTLMCSYSTVVYKVTVMCVLL